MGFDTLESLSDGLFEGFLALYCLLSKFGQMFKVLFLHDFSVLLAYELNNIKYRFKKLLNSLFLNIKITLKLFIRKLISLLKINLYNTS